MIDPAKEARNSRAVRNYMLFCFVALFCMVPVLLLKDMDLWCLFPLVLGALSLIANWRSGPIFVLLSLAVLIPLRARGLDPITCVQLFLQFESIPTGVRFMPATPLLDVLLSVCVLAYLAGHYRLQSLIHHVVPVDPRLQGRTVVGKGRQPTPPPPNLRRTPGVLTAWEIPMLGVVTLVSALAAEYAWLYFRGLKPPLHMWLGGWQTVTFVWFSACLLLLAWAGFGYYGRHRAKREQSLLYLQDQLWLETRREQSRISRWIVWARVRYQQDKEENAP